MIRTYPFSLLSFLSAFAFFAISTFPAESKIRIRKSALTRNPTLFFKGIAGSGEMTSRVKRDIRNCGWFKSVDFAPSAEYTLSGGVTGKYVRFILERNAIRTLSFKIPFDSRKVVETSQMAVDHILKRLFKVKSLCTSKIAFCAEMKPGDKEIFICDYDGGNVKRVTRNRTLSVEPDWEPGQRRLVYTMYSKTRTDIIEYDVASRRSRRLVHFTGLNSGAAVSPDGKYFAAILSKDGSVDLYVKSLNTAWMRRLTEGKAAESSPCWSPSGAKICYVSDQTGAPRLYVVTVSGKSRERLPTIGTEAVSPDWSDDGQIVYSAKMGRHYAIAVIDLSKKEKSHPILSAAGDWESPSWAPDNRHVVASRTLNGRSDLYVIDTWTGKARRILTGRVPFSMPSW